MYTLLVTSGPDRGLEHQIRSERVLVGTDAKMDLVLRDPTLKPQHFMVVFEEGGWKAVTLATGTTITVDRRWQHPVTRQRGARIFAGATQILLYAGRVDLETATRGGAGLDFDAETLRDDAINQVRDRPVRFRADMTGKAEPVNDRGSRRGPPGPKTPPSNETPNPNLPRGTLAGGGSQVFTGKAGMMRLPETVDSGRRAAAPEPAEAPKSARASWNPGGAAQPAAGAQSRALVKGQMISLTDTAISAMPSESRDLVVLHERDGGFAQALRILATRLEEIKTRQGFKSFLISSVNDGDGKTVLAANLALVMSEDSDRKVALVDANFRNPRAADLFNLDKNRGLLAALDGKFPLSQCVARVLGRNLVVLHAGGEHQNPGAVLASPKFKSLLAELNQAVDFMIVDAPSAIPHADVPLLTQHVDGVMMVGSAHRTGRAKLDKALETIGRARVVGSVFLQRKKGNKKK